MYHNVEKSAFARNRACKYVGWDARGSIWHIKRDLTSMRWWAFCRDNPDCFSARTLRDISKRLEARA